MGSDATPWQQDEKKKVIVYRAISLVHCKPSNVTLAGDDRCQAAILQGLPECN